ncbi:MAG TPA: PA14 domain-containing protein, partial [Planctomycetota bacterium]|nr:PA14 domain-containing protein [Planctomycetota bacterium]
MSNPHITRGLFALTFTLFCLLLVIAAPNAHSQNYTPTTVTLPVGNASPEVPPNGVVNLTQEGTVGWAQWGPLVSGTAAVNQKAGSLVVFGPQTSTATTQNVAGTSFVVYTWSDGTLSPITTASNTLLNQTSQPVLGQTVGAANQTISFVLNTPANFFSTQRTLKLYFSVNNNGTTPTGATVITTTVANTGDPNTLVGTGNVATANTTASNVNYFEQIIEFATSATATSPTITLTFSGTTANFPTIQLHAATVFNSKAAPVAADAIGINFQGGAGAGNLADYSGVLPRRNFNQEAGVVQPVAQALVDSSGAAVSGASVQWNSGVPTQGLTLRIYASTPQSVNNSDPDFNSLASFNTLTNGLTPAATVLTTVNGNTVGTLDYSNVGYGSGAMFNTSSATQGLFGVATTTNLIARFDGFINLPLSGQYNFGTTSDDGSMLWIDGNLVVNNNFFQGSTRRTGSAALTAGIHSITVGFYQGGGGYGLLVDYTPPGGAVTTIPNSILQPLSSPLPPLTTPTAAPVANSAGDNGGNYRMMKGYLDSTSGSWSNVNVALGATLPAALGSAYNVIVYADGTANETRAGKYYFANAGNTTITVGGSTVTGAATFTGVAAGDVLVGGSQAGMVLGTPSSTTLSVHVPLVTIFPGVTFAVIKSAATAGSGTVTSAGTVVTGSGTSFTTAVSPGDTIVVNTSPASAQIVTSINSNTVLNLSAPLTTAAGGVAYSIRKASVVGGVGAVTSSGTLVSGMGTGLAAQIAVGDTIIVGSQAQIVTDVAGPSAIITANAFSPAITAATAFSIGKLGTMASPCVGAQDLGGQDFQGTFTRAFSNADGTSASVGNYVMFTNQTATSFAIVATPDQSVSPPVLGIPGLGNPRAPINAIQIVSNGSTGAGTDYTWTGATDANWSTTTNWNPITPVGGPPAGSNLIFPSVASHKTNNVDIAATTFNDITISGDGYAMNTTGGNVMILTGSINCLNATVGSTIGFPIMLSGPDQNITVNNASVLNLAHNIDLNGNQLAVALNGTGMFNLLGSNGGTIPNPGQLITSANGGSLSVTGTGTFQTLAKTLTGTSNSAINFTTGTAAANTVFISCTTCSVLGDVTSTVPGLWTVITQGSATINPSNTPAAGVGIAQINISGNGSSTIGNLTGLTANSSVTTLNSVTIAGNITMAANAPFAGTGTAASATNSGTITGTSSAFGTNVLIGDILSFNNGAYTVTAITSATSLTVTPNVTLTNAAAAYSVYRPNFLTITTTSLTQNAATIVTVPNATITCNNPKSVFPNTTPTPNAVLNGTIQGISPITGVGTINATATTNTSFGGNGTNFNNNAGSAGAVSPGDLLVVAGQGLPVVTTSPFTTAAGGFVGSGGTVTVTTTVNHTFVVGQLVVISGAAAAGFNGIYTVQTVPAANQFTYTNATSGTSTVAGNIIGFATSVAFQPAVSGSYAVNRGTLTFNGTGYIQQTSSGVLGDGFAQILENMNANTGVLRLDGANTFNSQFTNVAGFLLVGNNAAFGAGGSLVNFGNSGMQAVGANRTIPNNVAYSTVTLVNGATNSNGTVTVASTAGLATGMFITGTNIPLSTTITGVTNTTTFTISQNASATATGLTFTASFPTFIVGPTAGSYAAIGTLGTPFDLQINGFLNFSGTYHTIQVNSLSTNGLICNNQTAFSAANPLAGSIVRGSVTAASRQQLVKTGAGVLTVNGPAGWGDGAAGTTPITIVSAGTLVIGGTGNLANGGSYPENRIDNDAVLVFDYSANTGSKMSDTTDSIVFNGTNATLWLKGNATTSVTQQVSNLQMASGMGIIKISNETGTGNGSTILQVNNNLSNVQNINIFRVGDNNPAENAATGQISFIRENLSATGTGTQQWRIGSSQNPAYPVDQQPLPFVTVTTNTTGGSQSAPAMYSGSGVTAIGVVPQIAGTVYNSVKSGNWDDITVWSPQGTPGVNDQAIINANHAVDLDAGDRQINILTFAQNGSLTGAANKLTVGKEIQTLYTYANASIGCNVELSGTTPVSVAGVGTFPAVALNATTVVAATNTQFLSQVLVGDTIFVGGTFVTVTGVTDNFNLATTAFPAAVTAGATYGIQHNSSSTPALAGNVQVDCNNSGALTISGNITETGGSHSLTKTGVGELILTSANSTYSGGTYLGTPPNPITNNVAGATFSGFTNLMGGILTLGADSAGNPVVNGPLGTGTLVFNYAQNTNGTGSTTNGPYTFVRAQGATPHTLGNNITTSGLATVNVFAGSANLTLTGNVNLITNTTWQCLNTGKTIYNPAGAGITGAFSLTKIGAGTLSMGGSSAWTGGFVLGNQTVQGPGVGTLELLSDSTGTISTAPTAGPLGTGTLTILSVQQVSITQNGFATIASGGTGARTVRNTLAINGQFIVTGNDLTLGNSSAGANAVLGGFTSTSGGARVIIVNNGNTTLDSPITQALTGTSLTKDGPGRLILSQNSTYSGTTTVAAGTLSLNSDSGQLSATTAIAIQPGAIFDISGGTVGNNLDHINNAATLNLNGGTFRYVTPAAVTGNLTETIGAVNVTAASTVRLDNTLATTTNLQLTATGSAFNFNGGTLSFERVAGGTGTTNLFLTAPAAGDTDAPNATVNGQFAEYDNVTPEGLRAKQSQTTQWVTLANGNWTDAIWDTIPTSGGGPIVIGGTPANNNVLIRNNVTTNGSQTCNSLSFDQGTVSLTNTNSTDVLTVVSGAINVGVGASAAAPTISGLTLNFGAVSGVVNNNTTSAAGLTIASPVTATSTGGLTVGGSGSTTISGALGFSGGLRVTGGTVLLSNVLNTYTGGTTVSGGTLSISGDGNLGAVSGGVTIQGGMAPNNSSSSFTGAGTITSSGAGNTIIAGTGTLFYGGTSGVTTGHAEVGDQIIVAGQATQTITVVTSATACVVSPGFSATQTAVAYTVQRFTTVQGTGTIAAGNTSLIGTSTSFLTQANPGDYIYAAGQMLLISSITNNSTLVTSASPNPSIAAGSAFQIVRSGNGAGQLATANSATVTGTNTKFLSQASVGDYIINNSGTVAVCLITAIASDTSLTVATTDNVTAGNYQILKANTTGGGTLTINTNNVQLNDLRSFAIGPVGATISVPSGLTLTVNSALMGNYPLIKSGAGRVTFQPGQIQPAASANGPASSCKRQAVTIVAAGQLRLGGTDCIGGNLGGNNACLTIVNSGAVLEVGPTVSTGSAQRTLLNNGATLRGIGNCTAGMTITPQAGATVFIEENAIAPLDRFTISGVISPGAEFSNPQNDVLTFNAQPAGFPLGVIVVSANNTGFEGTTVINNGIVQAGTANNTPSIFGDGNPQLATVTVNSGATLGIFNGLTLQAQVILNGGTIGCAGGNATLNDNQGGGGAPDGRINPSLLVTAPSTIVVDDAVTPGTARQFTISGIVAGSSPLTVIGLDGSRAVSPTTLTSVLILTNPNNTYSGTLTVNSNAQVSAQGAGTLGQANNPATVNLAGGYLEIRTNVSVNFPGKIVLNNPTLPGTFSQIASLQNGSYFPNQIATLTSLTVPSAVNAVLAIHGNNANGQTGITSGNNLLSFASASLTGTPIFDVQSTVLRFDGPVTGSGGITKQGPQALQFNAANTYTGDTTVLFGQVNLNGAASAVAGNVVVGTGGEFLISSAVTNSNTIADGKNITLNGGTFTLQASAGTAHNETVTNLNFAQGTSILNLVPNGNGGDAQLTVSALNAGSGGSLVLNRTFNNGGTNNANLLITGAAAGTNYYKVTVNEPAGVTGRGVYHTAANPDLGVVAYTGTAGGTGPYVYTSVQSGAWNVAANWTYTPFDGGGTFPAANDDVIIKPGHIMDLNGVNQSAGSVTFQASLPQIGTQFIQNGATASTLTTASSPLLINIPSPVGKKMTCTASGLAGTGQNNGLITTVTAYVPATGTITFAPPLIAPFVAANAATANDTFTLDFQVTSNPGTGGFTATSLAPYSNSIGTLAGQMLVMTSGNQIGKGATIATISNTGAVTFTGAGLAAAPAVGDQFVITSGLVTGVVGATFSTTTLNAPALSQLGGPNSVLAGQTIIFTGGAQAGRSAIISAVSTTGTATFGPALSLAPNAGDTFSILGASNGITGTNTLTVTSGAINVLALSGSQGQGIGLTGQQYTNPGNTSINFTNLAVNRIDPAMNLQNLTYNPIGSVPAGGQQNAGVWTGFIVPDFTEQYVLQSLCDDGGRVFINNQLLLDQFNPNGLAQNAINLTAGVKYPIRFEFANAGTNASWQLTWSSPNQTGAGTGTALAVVPYTNLFPAANNAVITCNLNFGAATGVISNSGGGILQIGTLGVSSAGVISGSNGLEIESNGTVALYAPNTYTGSTTIGSGLVQLGNNTALSSGTVTMQQNTQLGGALGASGFSLTLANPFTLAGDFCIANSPNLLTFTGNWTLTGNRIVTFNNFNGAANTAQNNIGICNLNGPIGDGGGGFSFAKAGTGFVQMNGNSTYGGNTIIYKGTMQLGISDALPTGAGIVVAGRQLNSGTQFLGNTTGVTNAAAVLNLNGFNQTCTGITLGFNDVYNLPAIVGDSTITSTNGGTLTVNVPLDGNGIRDRYLGTLSGSLNLTKNGLGSLGLYTVNTYTGTTTINNGTLLEGIANAIPVAAATNSNVIVNAAGTLDINGTASTIGVTPGASLTINGGAVINSTASGSLTLGGDVYGSGTTGHIDGGVIIANTVTRNFFVNTLGDVLTINAAIGITGTTGNATSVLNKLGAGTLLLTSGESQFPGNVFVNGGTLELDGSKASLLSVQSIQVNNATFLIDASNIVVGANPNRLFDQLAMTLNGGTLKMLAPLNVLRTETIGTLNFTGGNSAIVMQANGTGDAQFIAGSFTRSNGATITLDRSNAVAGAGLETGNLFFASPSPLSNNGNVPFALVTDNSASPSPVTNVQAIYTTLQGVVEGPPSGTLYISNGTGGGDWTNNATWVSPGGAHPTGLAGERVQIVGTDVVTIPSAQSIDQVAFTGSGTLSSGAGGPFTLTVSSLATSLNQIIVTGNGTPLVSTNLSVGGDFLINNQVSTATLTLSGVISNGATSASLPVAWYKFDDISPATVVAGVGTIANGTVAGLPVTGTSTSFGTAPVLGTGNPNAGDLIFVPTLTNTQAQLVTSVTAATTLTTLQSLAPISALASTSYSVIQQNINKISATGTLGAAAAAATTVTGSGTSFGSQIVIGDYIIIGSGTSQQCVIVSAINLQTQAITVNPGFPIAVAASSGFSYFHPNGATVLNSGSGGAAINGTLQDTSGGAALYGIAGPTGLGNALASGSTSTAGATTNLDGYVDVPNFTWPAGSPVTVSFWANLPIGTTMPSQLVFGVGSDTNNRFGGQLGFGDLVIDFDYGDATGGQGRVATGAIIGTAAMPPNTWNHVVMIAGGASSPYRAIYVNGVLQAQNFTGSSGPAANLSSLQIFRSLLQPNIDHHHGGLDDFRIYNRVLGPNEVATLYNKQDPQNATITKTGPGTVVFSGTNTFSSPVNVDAGVLSVSADANLGNATTQFPCFGTLASVAPQTITAATEAGNTVTITAPVGTLTTGTYVTIANVTPSGYNGTFYVATAAAGSFTYVLPSTVPGQPLGNGTAFGTATPATVTGTNTLFTTQLNVGDSITASGQTVSVVNITSATSLQTSPAFNPVITTQAFTVTREPQISLNGGTLLASSSFTSPASRPYSINSPNTATSLDAAAGKTFIVSGPMTGGTMGFNNQATSTGTVFVQSNNATLRLGQSHVNGGTLRVPTVTANPPISAMGGSQIFVNNGAKLELFTNTIVGSGTITVASNSTAVVGTGTHFTTEYQVNDQLVTYDDSGVEDLQNITAITDDTHLTIAAAFNTANPTFTVTAKNHEAVRNIASGAASTYNIANNMFLNNNAIVQGTGNMPNTFGNTTGIMTIAGGANVTFQTAVSAMDVLRIGTANHWAGGGNGSTITIKGPGRIQTVADNNNQLYTGNFIVNCTDVNPATGTVTGGWLTSNNTSPSNVANTITVTSGYFGANAANTYAYPIIMNGGTIGTNANACTYSGPISVLANSTLNTALLQGSGAFNLTLSGVISGSGGLSLKGKLGAGTVILTNPASTYNGTITANDGSANLQIAPLNSVPLAGPPANIALGNSILQLRSDTNTQYQASVTIANSTLGPGVGTITSAGTTVTGTNTNFQVELVVGSTIFAAGQSRTVTAIASGTSLTINSAFVPDNTVQIGYSTSGAQVTINVDRAGFNSLQNQQLTNLTFPGTNTTLTWTNGDTNCLSFTGVVTVSGTNSWTCNSTSATTVSPAFFGLGGTFAGSGTLNLLCPNPNPLFVFYGTGGAAPGVTINVNGGSSGGTVNITGAGGNGASPLNVNSPVTTVSVTGSTGSGALTLNSGTTTVSGVNGALGAAVTINSPATLVLDNSQGGKSNRLGGNVTLNNSSLSINSDSGVETESVGTLTLSPNTINTLTLKPIGSGDVRMTLGTLSRGLTASLTFNRLGGTNGVNNGLAGSDANLLFATPPAQGTLFSYITVNQIGPVTASNVLGYYDTTLGLIAEPGSVGYTSVKSGNWDDPTVWNPQAVPQAADVVTILSGHSIDLHGSDRTITAVNIVPSSVSGATQLTGTNKLTVLSALNINGNLSNGVKGEYYDSPIPGTNGAVRFVQAKQLAGNAATLTTTGNHLIPNTQGVRVALNPSDPLFDGVYACTAGTTGNVVTYNGPTNGAVAANTTAQGTAWALFNVTNKSLSGNVATLLTSVPHNLLASQTITVALGDPVFDGTFQLSAATTTTVQYTRIASNVAFSSTAFTVTNKALTNNVATLTTSSAHGFVAGQAVFVATGDSVFDGVFAISSVTSTTISYARVNANVSSVASGGTISGTMQVAPDLTRIDPQIYFGFNGGVAAPGLASGNDFSGRWTGFIEAPYTDTYTFFTQSDDGSKIVITPIGGASVLATTNAYNNGQGINDLGAGAGAATLSLTAGQRVSFDLIYEQGTGGYGVAALWASPTMGKQVIPQSAFTADAPVTISCNLDFGANAGLVNHSGANEVVISGNITGSNGAELYAGRTGTTGRLVLSGNNSGLSGPILVSSGRLKANSVISSTGTGTVAVNVGELGGTGTITGAVTVANSATAQVGPGVVSNGTLTLSGGLTLNAASVLNFDLGRAGVQDVLALNGNVTLNGTLNINPLNGFDVGSYTLMTTSGGTFSGSFGSIPS